MTPYNIVVASNQEADVIGSLSVLEQAGYYIVYCKQALDLIPIVTALQPCIVFVDPGLDKGEGLRVAERLYSNPALDSTMLIFILPNSPKVPDFYWRFQHGRIGVITRPFAQGQVLAYVAHIFRFQQKQ